LHRATAAAARAERVSHAHRRGGHAPGTGGDDADVSEYDDELNASSPHRPVPKSYSDEDNAGGLVAVSNLRSILNPKP
jgi:hypothetical protein